MPVLITAGATRNPIDAVRYLSADSSGRTGVSIGRTLMEEGRDVWLLGSGEARIRGADVPGEEYGPTRDLKERMERWVRAHPDGGVIHSAAVGDYEVATPAERKIPSGQDNLVLELSPTLKIADEVRRWGLRGPYATFKAAPPGTTNAELEQIAAAQRQRIGCDLVFANVLGRLSTGILLMGEEPQWYARRSAAIYAMIDWLLESVEH